MRDDAQTIQNLVKAFVDAVVEYSAFIMKDSTIANRHHDKFMQALKRLATYGDDGLSALANLLEGDRLAVRVTAACYLVHFRTGKALDVLKAAAKVKGRAIAMLAIVTLKRWEKGTYLDPATGMETKRSEET